MKVKDVLSVSQLTDLRIVDYASDESWEGHWRSNWVVEVPQKWHDRIIQHLDTYTNEVGEQFLDIEVYY